MNFEKVLYRMNSLIFTGSLLSVLLTATSLEAAEKLQTLDAIWDSTEVSNTAAKKTKKPIAKSAQEKQTKYTREQYQARYKKQQALLKKRKQLATTKKVLSKKIVQKNQHKKQLQKQHLLSWIDNEQHGNFSGMHNN